MASFSDEMIDAITSDSVTRDSPSQRDRILWTDDIEHLTAAVPYPPGQTTRSSSAMWQRDKVVRQLHGDLRGLKPRAWTNTCIEILRGAISRNDWYS